MDTKRFFVMGLFSLGISAFIVLIGGFTLITYMDESYAKKEELEKLSAVQDIPENVSRETNEEDLMKSKEDNAIGESLSTVSHTTQIAKNLTPTVVGISTIVIEKNTVWGEIPVEGVGSGVIVDAKGYILTNAHVVGKNPKKLTVYIKDGRQVDGVVLWQDDTFDLAVVKIELEGLEAAILGDSDEIEVGEEVIAIGNPLGLRYERTVTKGIVSGLNRSIRIATGEIMEDLVQTDAAINPGNSGGPLINGRGEVIGVNTVKAGAEGLGFAVPINITRPIIKKLIEKGKFAPAYIGVNMLDKEIAGYYSEIDVEEGVLLTEVFKGEPADIAGLKTNDIILEVNDIAIETIVQLKTILYEKEEGDILKVKYQRMGKIGNIEIKVKGWIE